MTLARARSAGLVVVTSLMLLASVACSRPQPDETPEGVVHLWLEKMEASLEDRRAAKDAYALLGSRARKNLEERAARASRVQGRQVEPYEMLAEGRVGLHFRPKDMTATVTGDEAVVEVRGQSSDTERASLRCRLEGKVWRVEPGLPEVPQQLRRDEPGAKPDAGRDAGP